MHSPLLIIKGLLEFFPSVGNRRASDHFRLGPCSSSNLRCFNFRISIMCVKIYICLLLVALGITAFAQGDEDLPRCDWPTGVCVYYNDTCPPDIPYDCHRDYNCPLATNKCCCRGAPPPPEPTERCDYPHGVCTFVGDGCPPDIPIDCRNKYYCPLATNKCCCRESMKPVSHGY
ncbi:uncharacterized protein LOC144633314 [Oculina patagonica]